EEPLEDVQPKKQLTPQEEMEQQLKEMMDPTAGLKKAVGSIARLATQAALTPAEYVGERVNKSVSYKHGVAAGKLAGTFAGAAGGVVGGAASGAAVGALFGGVVARGIAGIVTFWTPKPPSKPQDSPFGMPIQMMFGPPPQEEPTPQP
ncbi:MAG: hypothetical protein AB1758_29930, partial [Candidatus Eremiobacterota bacterium]